MYASVFSTAFESFINNSRASFIPPSSATIGSSSTFNSSTFEIQLEFQSFLAFLLVQLFLTKISFVSFNVSTTDGVNFNFCYFRFYHIEISKFASLSVTVCTFSLIFAFSPISIIFVLLFLLYFYFFTVFFL